MTTYLSLQNQFLIAMPTLADLSFTQSLVYICSHNEQGSMGIVVNRPIIDIKLSTVLSQMKISSPLAAVNEMPVYLGGPVQTERGFIIHRPNNSWQSTLVTSEDLAVTSSQDILQALAEGTGPSDLLVVLGYSGWDAGQLEKEIAENFWLTVPADPKIIFETSFELRWQAALHILGIDSSNISSETGHA